MSSDANVALLRHTLATLAYRAGKAVRGAPPEFQAFTGAGRTPAQILAHMGDLFDWALSIVEGRETWRNSTPLPWEQEVGRFYASLGAFDQRLAGGGAIRNGLAERLFQGPIADALTHTGQIAMLRRLAGCSMKGENYFKAEIKAGAVGFEQPAPTVEF
jgi:hypothetical protein